MSFQDVRDRIAARLNEADRGDRGWLIITRVHVSLAWLKGIAEYLANRGGDGPFSLTEGDYRQLAVVTESDSPNPGQQLRRHHLLLMESPLRLLQRTGGRHWSTISLTHRGRDLARSDDAAQVLEQSLSEMRFAVAPWTPATRIRQYGQFNAPVFQVTRQVLERCGGFIDDDEFDLFLSR